VSRDYLRHRGESPTEQQVITASEYFLNELPIGMDTPAILGVPESLCAYHRVLAFADVLQTGPGWLAPSANQGYLMVRPNG
jgi:cyclo(L-tyrosyl-L-tyrosyl) synthase